MGLCQYRHAIREVSPTRGRGNDRREIQRRSAGAPTDGSLSTLACMSFGTSAAGGHVAVIVALGRPSWNQARAINPNLFQDQAYKFGSFGNPDPAVRQRALEHVSDSIAIAAATEQPRHLAVVRRRIELSGHGRTSDSDAAGSRMPQHGARGAGLGQRLLVEYKPFEPAFYHTDIADWGMALLLARAAGRKRGCSLTPATTTWRRTSSRSSPGCSRKTCSEDFISTTVVMPTTT